MDDALLNDVLYITDEDGNEQELRVYRTITKGDRDFVLVYDDFSDDYDEDSDEEGIIALYADGDDLFGVEDPDDLAFIEEVLAALEMEETEEE